MTITTAPAPAAVEHLTTVIDLWPDLDAALSTRAPAMWPPSGRMSDYQTSLDRLDAESREAADHRARALRGLERSPDQIGHSDAPLRIPLLDLMIQTETGLLRLADGVAAKVQRPPYRAITGRGWSDPVHLKMALTAVLDESDPLRWRTDPRTRTTITAARWLRARAEGHPGPVRPLPPELADAITTAAAHAAARITRALDTVGRTETVARPCPIPECGGRIRMTSGAGLPPVARCTGTCGSVWTEQAATSA